MICSKAPRLAGGLLLLLAACSAPPIRSNAASTSPAAAPVAAPAPKPAPPAPPEALVTRLEQLAHGFDGRVGVAVQSVQDGWTAAVDGVALYPQQSVSKLWVAVAVLDQVDRGRLKLSDQTPVTRADMSVFHQPIQARLTDQGYAPTLDALLVGAIAQSDNAANDILVRRAGGSAVIQRTLAAKALTGIRTGPEERVLQSRIAGVAWRPEYSFGQAFWTAREQVAPAVRKAKLEAYLADPEDGAAPRAIVDGLARLKRGELLSPASTERLLSILNATTTGPNRLKAGLGPGWSIAHKTGTGQDLGSLSTGFNDVGLITAPDGRAYAVAVMIASTRQSIPERQRLMADVARAVVAEHDRGPRPSPG